MPITNPTWIFLIVLGIILFFPMLLERLRIPSVVGLILAGIVIGPHGCNIISRDASFELFGKVGLYYIMFLASLEMNIQDVKRIRGKALTLGLLGFVIPMSIGYIANSLILGYTAAAALLVAAMYASHTLITYPIVLRYGLSRLNCVNIAVGSTIVADTLTLLVLAVVGGAFKEASPLGGLAWIWLVVKVILLGLLIIYAFPPICRRFFRRHDDGVVQYVFVLALVFLGAGLMELVGMEGILGAFLAGIVLNRLIPSSSPLMNHIEFVGNALFIPYFLIGVGMLINLSAFAGSYSGVLVAAIMLIVGISSKWLATYLTQKIYKLSLLERRLMFGLTGSRAAATLAVTLVGFSIIKPDGTHLLSEDVLNGAMLLILVTCILSSFLTENTSRKLVLRARERHTEQPEHDERDRLLIAVKNKQNVKPLTSLALLLRTPGSPAPILALNIVLEDNPDARQTGLEQLRQAEKIAAATKAKIQTYSRWSVNVVSGISHTIHEAAISDLLLGLHHKTKLSETYFGKITNDIVSAIDRQILIYKEIIPLATVRRIHILVPSKAEYEQGFVGWMDRIIFLSREMSSILEIYSRHDTLIAIENHLQHFAPDLISNLHNYVSWNDFLPLGHSVRAEDMIIFILARHGTISHHNYMDHMFDQIERNLSQRNILFIYPTQSATEKASATTIRAGIPLNVRE